MSVEIRKDGGTLRFFDRDTGAELDQATATPLLSARQANRVNVVTKALAARAENVTDRGRITAALPNIQAYIDNPAPSQAQTIAQVHTHAVAIRELAEIIDNLLAQNNALIRLAVDDLTGND